MRSVDSEESHSKTIAVLVGDIGIPAGEPDNLYLPPRKPLFSGFGC